MVTISELQTKLKQQRNNLSKEVGPGQRSGAGGGCCEWATANNSPQNNIWHGKAAVDIWAACPYEHDDPEKKAGEKSASAH